VKKLCPPLAAVLLAACAPTEPTLQTGPTAEVTHDGLVRVDNSAFRDAWVDPTADLTGYERLMPSLARFEFRAVRDPGTRRGSASEFPISERNRERLVAEASAIFTEELARSQYFATADAPGPEVLQVRIAMLDIVSRVPPETAGRNYVFIDRVGEATLVLELADSMSGETLARAAERAAADPAGGGMGVGRGAMRANSVQGWAEVRRLFRRWATRLRTRLDALYERQAAETAAHGGSASAAQTGGRS